MRVLHYNIFDGFGGSSRATARFVASLREQAVEVLMLNEYRDESGLGEALSGLGFDHHVINRHHRSANRAALFSKYPFARVLPIPANARLAAAVIEGVHVVAYHASPHVVASVTRELAEVLAMLADAERVLLCGDLNSLSRNDREVLGYGRLTDSAAMARYRSEDGLSFSVMDAFERAGYIDNRGMSEPHTVPTARGRANEQGARLRLDYALSKNLPVTSVEVLREPPFERLSDYFPLRLGVGPAQPMKNQ
jgi:endonuclease/exonuclease/phosphatase family metal-dependent hydrolase